MKTKDMYASRIIEKVSEKLILNDSGDKKVESKNIISVTNIPFFDIVFENIFGAKNRFEIKVEMVEKNMDSIKKIYGYKKDEINFVTQINNQSYFNLEDSFPELLKSSLTMPKNQDSPEDYFKKISGQQSEKINQGHRVVYKNYDELPKFHLKLLKADTNLIDEKFVYNISSYLPGYLYNKEWELLYKKIQHGTSYKTLLSNCYNKGECIFIIKDSCGYKFGGFMSEQLGKHKDQFYGTGTCFLFKINNEDITIYRSSMQNEYFIACDEEGFGMGSDPFYGIFVENNLSQGSSHFCNTFNNDQLSSKRTFKISNIEIYGFRSSDNF